MASPSEEPVPMRKRVAKACETCRAMKSKCDGRYPSCDRCKGYGYQCSYSESGRRSQRLKYRLEQQSLSPSTGPTSNTGLVISLREAIAEYELLCRNVAAKLPEPEQDNVAVGLKSIGERVENIFSRLSWMGALPPIRDAESPTKPKQRSITNSQRYLGEASDVRFFNLVKRALQDENLSERDDEGMDSYEQDDADDPAACVASVELPIPEIADGYLDMYFSTIHVAYPFIQRSSFMKTYRKVREHGVTEDTDIAWLALLHIIFAIGAYYTSFPEPSTVHEQYFHRARALSKVEAVGRSVYRVSFLLAECFYLLAVCKTDRCWTTLGLAVRIAQSIGLHVESKSPILLEGQDLLTAETRRRVWYSIYVLDRLLSLQLGRPPAVHDDTSYVRLPSRLDDADINWETDGAQLLEPNEPTTGDYFLSVISLSKIIGYVLRDLYGPQGERISTGGLRGTGLLDKQLLEWKCDLPRPLRFDFGHAFETSTVFKKQRNMLAIKFHHLRALIHRPYLSIPLLRDLNDGPVTMSHGERCLVEQYEKTCVSEAQGTAHLLRNVSNQTELVCDFPWWQMISCLICASSILLVASIFTRRRGMSDGEGEVDILDDDAETCLKVFEALSANSDGARMARDMMTRLRECGHKWRDSREDPRVGADMPLQTHFVDQVHTPQSPAGIVAPAGHEDVTRVVGHFEDSMDNSGLLFGPQEWPSEIMDSMAWSAQIFGAVNNSQLPPYS